MSRRSRATLSRTFEEPVDFLCADERDAREREQDADALERLQALVEQEVGERDGDDREQAAEHRDEAEQAAGGGDREARVRAGVEQPDARRASAGCGAEREARARRMSSPSTGAETIGGADAGERVVLGRGVEGDERDADATAATGRAGAPWRPRRRRRARGSRARRRPARRRRRPLQRAGALAVESTPASTGTIAQVATIGATMLIVPTASAR